VTEVGSGGYAKARQWRRDESTDVALIPNSFLTKTLPLVRKGRILPVYRSRIELTDEGKPRGYLFPTEALAKNAAYLDEALIISAGAYVRNHNQEPGFALTDGSQIFRLYYYMKSDQGRTTHLTSRVVENPHCELHPHTEGDRYWRLLPGWQEAFPASKVTQISMPVVTSLSELLHPEDDSLAATQETKAIRPDEIDPSEVTLPSRPVRKDLTFDKDETHPNATPG
ncbi:MAG: hypothetical protein ABI947_05200, partial [Chloroflexota bacterium]